MEYPNVYFNTSFPAPNVLLIEINRPKKLNAIHRPAYLEYGEIIRLAGLDPEVRAIVIVGSGRAFCAGLDVPAMVPEFSARAEKESSRAALDLVASIKEFQAAIGRPYVTNKPVIGVAHGPCIGLAIDMLSAMDVRFAAEDAVMSVREIDIGMTADIGTLQRLPRIVNNLGWAKDVCFTGRNFGTAEALKEGFVQYTKPTKKDALAAALQYATELAEKSPVAMLGVKKSINYALDHTTVESLDQIAEFNGYALGADFIAGGSAMLDKRKPKYPKL